jgi:ATPase subunit of ABC transporter with duplicated ATPase domains
MQFGAKPLFENISVKFGDGNRYGLIGANGCGKSTFMKILGGDLEPSAGTVMLDPNERLGKLRQDQFAFEEMRVLDVVMNQPRYVVLRDTLNHLAHHRGQLTVYLRLCESKVPALYGPSADDQSFA